jgi:Uma2 family endonuclease
MAHPAGDVARFTYADYASWPDGERWELIEGEPFAMSPAPARVHQEVVVELLAQIHQAISGGPCRVYVAPFDVRLPEQDEADEVVETVVQPDISVVCDPGKLDEKGCRGAPDWIVEVLSPRTAAKDQIVKRDLYQRRGVREYWLVHPTDRLVFLYSLEGNFYAGPDIRPTAGRTPVSCLDAVEINWDRVFPREGAADGEAEA